MSVTGQLRGLSPEPDSGTRQQRRRIAGRSSPYWRRISATWAGVPFSYHEVQRPAVIEHPVTGRPILFVNPMHTHGLTGMTREEAWPLIEELAEHATQRRFVYYHHWRVDAASTPAATAKTGGRLIREQLRRRNSA